MKFDAQYWRGFLGGLRWVTNHISLPWDVFFAIQDKKREVKRKIESK